MRRAARPVGPAVMVAAALLLAGCAGSDAPAPATTEPTEPTEPTVASSVSAQGVSVGHVHNLALDGASVLLGTHQGLFRQEPGQPPALVGEAFDVMGLTIDGSRWWSSGHPEPGANRPDDLGLLQSTDRGVTWTSVSLAGKADFHRLTAAGSTVLGVNSGDGLLWRSVDSGSTWDTHGPGPYDVALNPADPTQGVATTQGGPVSSRDGGISWQPMSNAPLLALVAWTDQQIVGVAPDGRVHLTSDAGATWTSPGTVGGAPEALAADDARIVVLRAGIVWQSTDGGATFGERITGLPSE